MELQYAPQEKSPNRAAYVIVAGLVSTAAALAGVFLLSQYANTNIMGWHANYIIPIGAIIVGMVASSGYGLASYLTGLKIRKSLLLGILALQFIAYFAAEYIDFKSLGPLVDAQTGQQLTFPTYFDRVARSFTWSKEHSYDKQPEALGLGGYFFVGLEILGFAAGSLIVPAALMAKPYCELCQLYMNEKQLATLPGSVPARKIKKKDVEANARHAAEQAEAGQRAEQQVNQINQLVQSGDAAGLRMLFNAQTATKKASEALPRRLHASLARCKGCGHGHLKLSVVTGQGRDTKSTELQRHELSREFVDALSPGIVPAGRR